jgi:PAS domain S-box-containing protein
MNESALEPAQHKHTILIVDDNPANLSVLSDHLEERGFRILVAQSGAKALERARRVQPDLILLDALMPEMDGFEICRRLKADEATQAIPVIFMTVLTGAEEKVKAFELGAVDYMTKPLLPEEVLARVATHLRLRSLTRRLEQAHAELAARVGERTAEIAERQRVEAALRESEERYRLISEVISDYTFSTRLGPQGELTLEWVTGAFERITGYTFEEYVARGGWLAALHPDDAEQDARDMEALRANRPVVTEVRTITRSGGLRWVRVYAHPVWDEANHRLAGIYGAVQDITERKQAEAALRESEARYRGLFEDSPVALWEEDFSAVKQRIEALRQQGVTDFRSHFESHPELVTECMTLVKVLDMNKAGLRLYGAKSKDELVPRLNLVIPAEAYPVFQDELLWIAEGRTAQEYQTESANRTLTGERIDISLRLSVAPGCEDTLSSVLVSIVDITARKRAEADLRRRAEEMTALYHTALEIGSAANLPDLLWKICDRAASLIGVDKGGLYLYDEARQELELVVSYKLERDFTGARLKLGEGVGGRVVQTGEPLTVSDYSHWAERAAVYEGEPFTTVIGVPLKWQGRVTGAIALSTAKEHSLVTANDERLLGLFAQQAAMAIENARLFSSLAQEKERLELLYHIARQISVSLDVRQIAARALAGLCTIVGARQGAVYVREPPVAGPSETLRQVTVFGSRTWTDDRQFRLRMGEGLAGWVAAHRQSARVADVNRDERWITVPGQDEVIRSVLSVPLMGRDELVGVLSVGSDREAHFTEDHQRLVESAAASLAAAMTNARLFEAEARRRREAETLRAATQALSTTLDLRRVLELILDELQQVVPYDSTSVQQLKAGAMEIIAGRGFPNVDEALGERFSLTTGRNPNQDVARTRAPVILDDAPATYDGFRVRPFALSRTRSWLGVPLLFGDRLIGMITLDKREPGFYTQEHARLALAFAAQAAIAMENARLFESERAQLRLAQTLQEVGALLTAQMSLEEVFENLFDLLARVIPYDSASIQLLDTEGQMYLAAGRGFPDWETARRNVREVSRKRPVDVWFGQKVMVISETMADDRWLRVPGAEYIRSWIGAALIVRGELIGTLTADSATPNTYHSADGETVTAFANQAAVAIVNARMVTELKQAETEREALIAELEAKNAELERFTYTVSHDLKNPLITIRGFLGYLERDAAAGNMEKWQADMARITGAAEKMHLLLDELLELSRIGRLMNPPVDVPLSELAHEAASLVAGRIAGRGVTVDIAPDLPTVYGDRIRLRELFENLIDNAVKFMGDQPHPRVEVGARREGEATVCFVRDNGTGIDPRFHEKVFGLFERLDQKVEGTGVGLAIVRRIVEVHGGRIWVESAGAGRGSTFCFTLPPRGM